MLKYLALLSLSACASYHGSLGFKVTPEIFYKGEKDQRLKGELYRPEGSGPFPGVLLVHGGGWQSRDLGDMRSIARSLASHGFLVFNMNYRLSPEHRHPAPIEDRSAAISFLRLNAQEYSLDSERLGLWGYSSGGHTVSFYALTNATDPKRRVQAVVTGGAPYDFTWYPHSPYIHAYTGFYRDQALTTYINASPINFVSKDAPPFLIYHAREDKLVELAQSTAFEARFKALLLPVERYEIDWWGHATAFALSDAAVARGVIFLQKHLGQK